MTILLALFFTLPGVNYMGDRVYYADGRSLSLGGIGSVIEFGKNPAAFCFTDRITGSITPSYIKNDEHRGLRVYDSYGNNIGTSTITNNIDHNIGIAASSIILPIKNLRIGFQYSPLWSFDYYYRREYRDDFYQLFRTETHEYTGSVYSLSPVLSFSYNIISIGFRQDFIIGSKDVMITVIRPDLPDSIVQQNNSYEGKATRAGIVFSPNKHFAIGYSYVIEYSVEDKQTGSNLDYPAAHAIGFFYQPAARIPSKFYGEFSRELWTHAINIFKVGIEHTVARDYSIRYGFCIFPDYEQTAVWTTVLTVGGGYRAQRFHFDIAYSYSKRDYSSNDFAALEDLGNIQIDESSSIFLTSLSFTF